MADRNYQSWGRYPKAEHEITKIFWRHQALPLDGFQDKTFLPYGVGRSYGDVCLNHGGALIHARPLNRLIRFDAERGILRCEAGVLLSEILAVIVPQGWFLPVSPGTQFVTVGGAIANDIHGKNHHRAGTFGRHVLSLELLRSDGTRRVCSEEENPDWFRATIGGLGLTGLITWAEFQLKPIPNAYIRQETIRFPNLDAFFELSAESDADYDYTVAWVDSLAGGSRLGRGLFFRGNHAEEAPSNPPRTPKPLFSVPVDPPVSIINYWTLKAFNTLYYHKQLKRRTVSTVHYIPFFYPLDAVGDWNRIYGPKGFMQYQCVVPHGPGKEAIREILERIASSGIASFLAVLKIFGDKPSPGLLSFPKPGVTLALDFPNQGEKTFSLLDQLDQLVREVEGAVYPAKDARMSAENFADSFPHWKELEPYVDGRFSSSFWRRIRGESS